MKEKIELIKQLESITMSMRVHPDCVNRSNVEFCDMVDGSIEFLRKYPEYTRITWSDQEMCNV